MKKLPVEASSGLPAPAKNPPLTTPSNHFLIALAHRSSFAL
jgi:hypothetical protein